MTPCLTNSSGTTFPSMSSSANTKSLSLGPDLFKYHFLYKIWQEHKVPKAVTACCWEVGFSVLLVTENGPTHPLQSCFLDKTCCWLISCQRSNNLTQEPPLTLKLLPTGCVQATPHLQHEVGRCLFMQLNSVSKKLGNASLFLHI